MTLELLLEAIRRGDGIPELQAYLAAGSDVNAAGEYGDWTLLHQACEHQNFPVLRALVAAGADLNYATPYTGWTPLHQAVDIDIDSVTQATSTYDEFIEKLTFETTLLALSLGADPHVKDHRGMTPFDYIISQGQAAWERFRLLAEPVLGEIKKGESI